MGLVKAEALCALRNVDPLGKPRRHGVLAPDAAAAAFISEFQAADLQVSYSAAIMIAGAKLRGFVRCKARLLTVEQRKCRRSEPARERIGGGTVKESNFDLQTYLSESVERVTADAIRAAMFDAREAAFMVGFAAAAQKASKKRLRAEKRGEHIPAFLVATLPAAAICTVPTAIRDAALPRRIPLRWSSFPETNGSGYSAKRPTWASASSFLPEGNL